MSLWPPCPLLALGGLLALGASGCEPPPVFATQDRRQSTASSRLEGQLLVTGPARGDAIVFLFDAARPPPPLGTGRPVSFGVVPAAELYGPSLGAPAALGPFTAPFTFSLVPPGSYLVRGFIDADGCLAAPVPGCRPGDFNPWLSVTSEPNKGDVGGAAVDLGTSRLRVIPVDAAAPTTHVTVSFRQDRDPRLSTQVPFDRPAFRVNGTPTFDATPGAIKLIELVPAAMTQAPVDQREPVFMAQYVDDDGDGRPDDQDGDGKPDIWPKVFVRKLHDSPPYLLDENDLDRNGIPDPPGPHTVDYAYRDGPPDGLPDFVVLAAKVISDEALAALAASGGAPVRLARLPLALGARAFDVKDPRAPRELKTVPRGRYAITVMQFTGQTWRVPNEQSPLVEGALGVRPVESQGFVLEVP